MEAKWMHKPCLLNYFAIVTSLAPLSGMAQVMTIEGRKFAAGPSPWSGGVSLQYARSIIDSRDSFFSETLSADLSVFRKIWNDYKLSVGTGVVQELDGLRDAALDPSFVGISKGFWVSTDELLSAAGSLRAILPTNQVSAAHTSFQGAVSFSPSFVYNDDRIAFGDSLSVSASVSYRENFYRYGTNQTGGRNLARSITPGIAFGYAWHPKWSLNLSAGHSTLIDTEGSALDDIYTHSESIGYQADASFGISVGHAIEDTTAQYDRISSNVKVMDQALSQVFAAMNYSF